MKEFAEIIKSLIKIQEDFTVPKNVRAKIKNAISVLQEKNSLAIEVKIDKSIQELDDVADDPNMPIYTRTQIWSVVSLLEAINNK